MQVNFDPISEKEGGSYIHKFLGSLDGQSEVIDC
jgi:hypothetical protein